MKKIVIITALLIGFLQFGHSQEIPIMEDVFDIQPIWSYLSVDTNFYNLAPPENLYTPYWGRNVNTILVKENNVYVLEYGLGHGFIGNGSDDGYLLHNLDLNTGESIWVHHDNYFTGNTHQITSFNGNIFEADNGNLFVNGNRNIDPIDTSGASPFMFSWYGTPFKHEIDVENGFLIDEKYDPDTSHVEDNLFPFMFTKNIGNGLQYKVRFTSGIDEGFLKNYLNLYLIDENSIVDRTPVFTYEHNTNIENGLNFFTYANQYAQINENKAAVLFGTCIQVINATEAS